MYVHCLPSLFGSLYWGMLIYFLSWNLLDVAHSYLMCCGGWICCFRFSRFGRSCLRQWLTCCVCVCVCLLGCTEWVRDMWLDILNKWWAQNGAKIPNPVRQILPDVPWGGDVKSCQTDNPKIPNIFFRAPVSPLNSTLYAGRIVYCYQLFHVLVNKLLELNEVSINLFVGVSLRINDILTQYIYIYIYIYICVCVCVCVSSPLD